MKAKACRLIDRFGLAYGAALQLKRGVARVGDGAIAAAATAPAAMSP